MSIFNEAISVTGIGLVIVFLGLIILIVFVYILAGLFHDRHSGQKAPEAPAPAAAAAPAPVAAPMVVEQGVDPQVVAVIAAAIAAMDSAGKPRAIRSIRRVTAWNRAARAEQVYRF